MLRIFLFVVTLGVVLGLGALLYLGAFPPAPRVHQVEKTLPAEHLGQ